MFWGDPQQKTNEILIKTDALGSQSLNIFGIGLRIFEWRNIVWKSQKSNELQDINEINVKVMKWNSITSDEKIQFSMAEIFPDQEWNVKSKSNTENEIVVP